MTHPSSLPTLLLSAALVALPSLAAAQPTLVKDIKKGPQNSLPAQNGLADGFVTIGEVAYFIADDGLNRGAPSLYRSDGSTAGTYALSTNVLYPSELTVVGKKLFFMGRTAQHGQELHVSDGTAAGTKLVVDLYRGTRNGIRRILGVLGNEVYFWGIDFAGTTGNALWRSDGTAQGTKLVKRQSSFWTLGAFSSGGHMVALGKHLYFPVPGSGRDTVWRTDGTLTTAFHPFGSNVRVRGVNLVYQQKLYVSIYVNSFARYEVWTSDGTLNGSKRIGTGIWERMTPCGNTMFFSRQVSTRSARELWKTDGTVAGTKVVSKRAWPHGSTTSANAAMLADGKMVFSGNSAANDFEPWFTDGTDAGTVRLANVHPSGSSHPYYFTKLGDGGLVAFQPFSPTSGREWWVTDGTPKGTRIAIDYWPGTRHGAMWSLNRAGDRYFFWGGDAKHGYEPRVLSIKWAGGTVVVEYGAGCKGSAGIPQLSASGGAPKLGNNKFALQLAKARAKSASALFVSGRPLDVALGKSGCRLLIDPAVSVVEGRVTDANGRWTLPLPIPQNTAFVGLDLYWQAWIVDPNGALNPPGLSSSNGLRTLLGL